MMKLNKDAALLRLESAATLNATGGSFAHASPPDTTQLAAGVHYTVTGWGATAESGGTYPDALMEVQVPIVSYEACMTGYGGMFDLDNNYHLCAGYIGGGKDSCYGDSGGPLIVPNGSGWLQAGIVSFGEGCASANYYGVYARVSYFKSWIDATIGGGSGELDNPVYLPLTINTTSGTSQTCIPDPAGESDNISDALIICSGNTVSGNTSYPNDLDDVYKIYVQSGRN
jgi:secreted trypsin-like serine protease